MFDLPNPLSKTQGPTDVQSFKIKIDGKAISGETPVMSIVVQKMMNKIATLKLYIQDGDPAKREFALSNKDDFKPGKEIEVQMGYHNQTETVFKGLIVKHSVKARGKEAPHLYVEAKDKAILMTLEKKSAYFNGEKDIDIIKKIAKKNGLSAELSKGGGGLGMPSLDALTDVGLEDIEIPDLPSNPLDPKPMVQYNCTDWDFIVMRAEASGYMVATDNGNLQIFKPEAKGSPAFVATYGDNIFEYEAELDSRRTKKKFTTQAWDFAKQEMVKAEKKVKEDSAKIPTSLGDAAGAALGALGGKSEDPLKKEITLKYGGKLEDAELKKWAEAQAKRSQLAKICGRVKVQGNASLKPGQTIQIKGIGDKFDGKTFVTGVLHQFGGEVWKTDIQFGWAEEWFHKQEDVTEPPAAGLVPGIQGLQIGVVSDIDDFFGGEFRVKVKIPTVNQDEEGVWARVATLDAGKNRGTFFRPEKGDEVVLGFLNGDPRQAIILGCMHSSKNASPLDNSLLKAKQESGIVTKNGLKLVFDDLKKSILITDGLNEISMGVDGISIKSKTLMSIESNAMLDVKAKGIININGKIVNIN